MRPAYKPRLSPPAVPGGICHGGHQAGSAASASTPLPMPSTPLSLHPAADHGEFTSSIRRWKPGHIKKRTFYKFNHHAVDLDAFLDMSMDDLIQMFPTCARSSNDARTAPTSTTKESSSSDDFNPALPRRNEEAAPTIDTTVAILMEKNEELSLECDRLRDDLAAKKKNSKTLVELICSLRNERDMLKNELIKQKERNIASAEKASSILKTVCLERDKSDIEYKILLQDKVQLQKLNLEYADIAILALLERQKAQDKLMHLMLESCSEREETLKEMSSLVGYMSDVGRTSQNPPRLSSNSSGTSFQQCMLCAPTTSTH
ncbi:hypothetical protein QYE76_053110 [Lolium multiflorum]|uniref:Uncharacterized protein n=1 Tax=Lolium multiflorum TaxID=4521 RepID=A0AAD8SV61_LOLMU|nr:hypothetical protein QYE76_053110 [Lolium multiflorum]